MNTVNEKSTSQLTLSPKGLDGLPVVVTSLQYRIDCLTSGTEVRDWTAATTGSADVVVPLTVEDSTLVNPANPQEYRRVTVDALYNGGSSRITSEFDYVVLNLNFIS